MGSLSGRRVGCLLYTSVKTEPLSGYERLKVLHDVFNMDSNEPFRFSFDMVARTGLSSKDFIAPTSFDFREGKLSLIHISAGKLTL